VDAANNPATSKNDGTSGRAAMHWVVPTHHWMRSASFAWTFVTIALHLGDKGYGSVIWILLALQFLVYPHLLFWRASRAADPLRTELDHLLLDAFLVGLWMAGIGFPVWIAFMLFMCTSVNNAITRGRRGIFLSVLAFSGGALVAGLGGGLHWSPQTGWPVTVLCIGGLAIYVLAIGDITHSRNDKLRETRTRLLEGEQALLRANEVLCRQLDEIYLLQEKLREQANRDPLTGLYNRRFLDATLQREVARCRRGGQAPCLLMIDIDDFKRINDSHGHIAGDEVLCRTAGGLQDCVRMTDTCGRWGGEEFLCVLPDTGEAGAQDLADRMRLHVEALAVPWQDRSLTVTISIGLARLQAGETADAFITRADAALYRAKETGRNRVVAAAV
jgi:diguanylate cyclase (GGDEF)-like protein